MKVKDILPLSIPGNEDFYMMPNGSLEGYPSFQMLSKTFDTVRQFYDCLLKKSILQDCEQSISGSLHDIGFDSYKLTYHFTKSFKGSGYQYSLQNKTIGIQALFKRSHLRATQDSSQIKLELSPHFLVLPVEHQESYIRNLLNHLTQPRQGKEDYLPVHYALHYALDFQLPNEGLNYVNDVFPNFPHQLKGFRGQKGYKNQSLSYEMKDFELVVNGLRGDETITVGTPSAMQFTIYRKDIEMVKSNKVEFFKDIWGDKYDPEHPVFRIELRLHQDQLKPFTHITGNYYLDYIKEGNWDLMRHFLTSRIRYMDSTKTVLNPLWLKLLESISEPSLVERVKPKKDPLKVDKNLSHILGNTVSMLFKVGLSAKDTYKEIVEMLEQRIFKSAFIAHFHLDHTDPSVDLILKDKLYDYVFKRFEDFQKEYLI